ncbi:MAG TPA: 8-amino-7-oxononanoate synthase [Nitrospinota bacterium]|jgi:glycine C-acetyltransferase/8-amino-7-oxononanoate synthase|nr:8-amino-7-oxononanoate synthase [Nitrospinota bacterium]
MLNFFTSEIQNLKNIDLYRKLKLVQGSQGSCVSISGKKVILLCSNNYLGLANHPSIKKAANKAIKEFGCGSGASRLISGTMKLHSELEKKIALFKNTNSALVFNSGYHANIGTLSALMKKRDIVFCDELNHASIIDGCRLSGAEIAIYPHKDMDALERHLKKSNGYKKRLIITDGVFSMDGDIAPLPDIVFLAKKYSALTMVDDAHATGVFGKNGKGITEHFNLSSNEVDIQMGTFGKALGSFGAYIAGNNELIDYLINRARSFIYTTALPPAVPAASLAAIEMIQSKPDLRKKLWKNVDYFKKGLKKRGFENINSQSQIIPIIIGNSKKVVMASEYLFNKGVFVVGIRPPAVPRKKERLRITIMSSHTRKDLDSALNVLLKMKEKILDGRP